MKAIILNSGLGKRMGEFTRHNHKSLAKLANGETIFARQLRLLSESGVTEFVITTGPFAEQLQHITEQFPHLNFEFVPNEVYASTNYIYSLYLAQEHLKDDVLLLHGDLVFSRGFLAGFLADQRPQLVAVNKALPQPEKDFKARVKGDCVWEVSVNIFEDDCFALQPMYKLSQGAMAAWMTRIEEYIGLGRDNVYAEEALNDILPDLDLALFSYEDFFIEEIDTLQDLERVAQAIRLHDFREQSIVLSRQPADSIARFLTSHRTGKPLIVADEDINPTILNELGLESFPLIPVKNGQLSLEHITLGKKFFMDKACDALVSIGSCRAIEAAKAIKYLTFLASEQVLDKPAAHLAIPLPGSGSEATCTAVFWNNGIRETLTHDALLPDSVLLVPPLLTGVSSYLRKSALIGNLAQAIESLWAVQSCPESIGYGSKAISTILTHYQAYLQGCPQAAEEILQASVNCGKAVNLAGSTAARAMSYKLAALKGLDLGHANALCLPSVWQFMLDNLDRCTDPRGITHLGDIFNKLNHLLGVSYSVEAVSKFTAIFYGLNIEEYTDELQELRESVMDNSLANNPIDLGYQGIDTVYQGIIAEREAYLNSAALADHKQRSLEAYDWFAKFCQDNEISYVILGGSIVGALRHGGFVPWDDDIDIGIPLADLDKFRKLSKASLPPGFAWTHPDTNRTHPRLFGKIIYQGVCCIDLFPIVKTSANPLLSTIQYKLSRFWYKVYWRTINYGKPPKKSKPLKSKLLWLAYRALAFFLSREQVLKINDWIMRWFEGKEAKRYISICGRYPYAKELIDKDWLEKERQYVQFEGRSLPVFHNYMAYIKRLYGNHMIMPPAEKRKSDHHLRIDMHAVNGIIPSYMPRLHQMECEMLREFIEICNQYKLRYFAISGTVLGAVRHNGFIPWDDDIDLGMPRPDYDTFIQVAPKHLSSHLFLQTFNSEPGCPRYFAKIRNSNTTFIEVNAKRDKRNRGIYIDIFPLDGFPSSKLKGWQCIWKNKVYEACIRYQYNSFRLRRWLFKKGGLSQISTRLIGFAAMKTIYRGKNLAHINQLKEDYFKQFKYDECSYVYSYGGVYGLKELIPKRFLGEGIVLPFEGIDLVVPEQYDEYLRHFYGNYMKFPPEHKRSVGHPRAIVDLNRSYRFYQ